MKVKVLVNIPSKKLLGGVSGHYEGLKLFWTEKVKYNTVGRRKPGGVSGKYWLPWDILKFIFRLICFRPDVVLLNPSLGRTALKRDFVFMRLSRCLGSKVAVFIHGFDWDYARRIDKDWAAKNLNKAALIFVLAKAFEDEIRSWGVHVSVCLTTTKVNDVLLAGFDISSRQSGMLGNILFLSRVERTKGVFITVDAYKILKPLYPNLRLTIVGDGNDLEEAKEHVRQKGLPDVVFTGRLAGDDIAHAFREADVFFLPSYGEGMPTAVLEAMAFGLPVFTRNVGGLVDFFEDGKMGYITDSFAPDDFADALVPYLENPELVHRVALYNHQYAKQHFMASSVALQIEAALRKHCLPA